MTLFICHVGLDISRCVDTAQRTQWYRGGEGRGGGGGACSTVMVYISPCYTLVMEYISPCYMLVINVHVQQHLMCDLFPVC